jgi:hypothetical protein
MGKSATDLVEENSCRTFWARIGCIEFSPVYNLYRFVRTHGRSAQSNDRKIPRFGFEFVIGISLPKINAPSSFVQPNLFS